MSLPPKLLERLQKRGIIQPQNESKKPCNSDLREQSKSSVIGCPSKYDENHDCTTYCELKFGLGTESPSLKIRQIYETIIEKYPLDEKCWQSVWDPGCGRYYFYNIQTDQVSWYPPEHPKFAAKRSANALRAERDNSEKLLIEQKVCSESGESENDKIDEELDESNNEFIKQPIDNPPYNDQSKESFSDGYSDENDSKSEQSYSDDSEQSNDEN